MKVEKKHRSESFESMMRRFKKGCEKTDVLNEVKKREHFEKPSMTRRISRKMAVKKELRRQTDQRVSRFSS
jgi:small subunit ribosomal protein S21